MIKTANIKRICFLTCSGFRTPKYIWQGQDKFGHTLNEMTKPGLKSATEMNNEVFTTSPELLKN